MTKPSRRSFIAKTSLFTIGATTTAWADSAPKQMLIHHVFFWLKNPSSKEDLAKLIEGIRTLEKIETLKEFKLGTPAKTTKRDVIDDSYAISLFTRFSDIAGHDVYQEHPVHKKFIENYSSLWSNVKVYDSMDL
jgi:hypothetical protein